MTTWQYYRRLAAFRPWIVAGDLALRTLFSVTFQVEGMVIRRFFDGLTAAAPIAGAGVLFGGSGGSGGSAVWTLVALIVAARLARIAIAVAGIVNANTSQYLAATLLQKNLLVRILERPGARPVPGSTGEAMSRFRGDVEEVAFLLSDALHLVGMAVFVVIAVAVMLQIDPLITLVVFLPVGIVIAVSQLANARIKVLRERSRAAAGEVSGLLGEMFGAAQSIQVAAAESAVIAHFRALNAARLVATVRDKVFTEVLNSTWGNAVSLGTGVVLLMASSALRAGTFTVGEFALFVYYLSWMADFPRQAGATLARWRQASVSLRRMDELLQGAPPETLVAHGPIYERQDPPDPPAPRPLATEDRLRRLEALGLTYCYPGTTRGIHRIDLALERGSFTVVTGRVGAGKTTLLRVLLGLLPVDTGTISWNGQTVADPGTFFVPPRSAYTPQVPRLFSESLRDNILAGLPEAHVDLPGALRAAVFERDVAEMRDGLDTLVGPRGVRLSGGQLQRAAAARMFVRDAELLVFDDLSSALDVETERQLWQRLASEGAQRTVLAVSHRHAALRRADTVIVLRHGRLEASGSLETLLNSCEEMRRLWEGKVEFSEDDARL